MEHSQERNLEMLPWCFGLALQTALSSVPICSPLSGFLADRVPDGLQREEVVMSATLITGSRQPGLLLGGCGRRLYPDPFSLSLTQRNPPDCFVSLSHC